jgi:hypothetical protein
MKKNFLIPLLLFIVSVGFSQSDTIIHGVSYNTVIYYQNFNFKGDHEASTTIIAFGNMKDGIRHGDWMYANEKGTVLAKGKYRKGYKVRDWVYYSGGGYRSFFFSRSQRLSDRVGFRDNREPQIIDESKGRVRMINGHIFHRSTPTLFL